MEIGQVKSFLSLTRAHRVKCPSEYTFLISKNNNNKKQKSKKAKETKEERRISPENQLRKINLQPPR